VQMFFFAVFGGRGGDRVEIDKFVNPDPAHVMIQVL